MSRIDDLIEQYAPDGVEYKALGDAFEMRAGKSIRAVAISPIADETRPFPCYGGNGTRGYVAEYSHEGESLLIGRQGALSGNIKRTCGKFYATEHAVVTAPRSRGVVDVNFAYHLLGSVNLNQYVSQGAQPGLAVGTIAKIAVPVPPIEVQREIARVLDALADVEARLEAELEAELEARRQQYAHYRDRLLSFAESGRVRWVPMSDIGTFVRGRRFTKSDVVAHGIPCIHYGEIYTHYGVSAAVALSHVRAELGGQLRYAKPGDVVIAGVGETVEDVAKAVAWLGDTDVAIHDDSWAFRSELDPTYVAYAMQARDFQSQKDKYVARAKVKRISAESLGKILIPVPDLEEQRRVVAVLDKFHALVNDLSSGLPAEIAARRKQYAYYRDRLFSFEEAAK